MSILKAVNGSPRTLEEMYRYLTDPKKTIPQMTFGIGVNPKSAVKEMTMIQKMYHYEELQNQYKQFVFSFDKWTRWDGPSNMNLALIYSISYRIGTYLIGSEKRQLFGAIHFNKLPYLHCHYMINWISIDGKRWRQEKSLYSYKQELNTFLRDYGLTIIRCYEGVDPENYQQPEKFLESLFK